MERRSHPRRRAACGVRDVGCGVRQPLFDTFLASLLVLISNSLTLPLGRASALSTRLAWSLVASATLRRVTVSIVWSTVGSGSLGQILCSGARVSRVHARYGFHA